jgi:hypothetical protein
MVLSRFLTIKHRNRRNKPPSVIRPAATLPLMILRVVGLVFCVIPDPPSERKSTVAVGILISDVTGSLADLSFGIPVDSVHRNEG